jgi:hypothetical protein
MPFAIDAAIEVRHADRHQGGSIDINRYLAGFETDCVCEVTAFELDDVLRG